jgi:hypothetical protein
VLEHDDAAVVLEGEHVVATEAGETGAGQGAVDFGAQLVEQRGRLVRGVVTGHAEAGLGRPQGQAEQAVLENRLHLLDVGVEGVDVDVEHGVEHDELLQESS